MSVPILLISEIIGVIAVIMILSISPVIRNQRLLTFKYPKREGSAALSVGVLVVLITAILLRLSGAIFTDLANFPSYPGLFGAPTFRLADMNAIVSQSIFSGILLLPIAAALLIRKQPLLSIGLNRNTYRAGFQMGAALALLTIFLHGKIFAIINGLHSDAFLALAVAIIAVIGEEVVFRGYVQPRFSAWLGEKWGWLAAALLYIIWWTVVAFAILPFTGIALAGAVIYRVMMGLLLGWLMKKNGSLLAPILYHAAHLWVAFL